MKRDAIILENASYRMSEMRQTFVIFEFCRNHLKLIYVNTFYHPIKLLNQTCYARISWIWFRKASVLLLLKLPQQRHPESSWDEELS